MNSAAIASLLLSLGGTAAIPAAPQAVPGSKCRGASCPAWPVAVHLEGTLDLVTSATDGNNTSVVTATGTAVWDTMGDASKPGASLSYTKRQEYIEILDTNQSTELWQLCPEHSQYRNISSGSILPGGCTALPQPCFHRYDPISLALAACSSWKERAVFGPQGSKLYTGSRCNFAGFPLPGQSGTFEVYITDGKIQKLITNTTTNTIGTSIVTLSSETITVTEITDEPKHEVFKKHCTPK